MKDCYNIASSQSNGSQGGGGGGSYDGQTVNDAIKVSSIASLGADSDSDTHSSEQIKSLEFADISDVPWAKEAIEAFSKSGVIVGREQGVFAPNDTMTRVEFIKVVVLAFDLIDDNANVGFEDVAVDSWCYKYVASAKQAGIINGISDTVFGAGESIKREDMAVIMVRLAEKFGVDLSGEEVEFSDKNKISDYAYSAVMKLSRAGIITGMGDGTFSPDTYVTRAQGAKVIYDISRRKDI